MVSELTPSSRGMGANGAARRMASAQLRSNSSMPLGRTGGHCTLTWPSACTTNWMITVPCSISRSALFGKAFTQRGLIFAWSWRK